MSSARSLDTTNDPARIGIGNRLCSQTYRCWRRLRRVDVPSLGERFRKVICAGGARDGSKATGEGCCGVEDRKVGERGQICAIRIGRRARSLEIKRDMGRAELMKSLVMLCQYRKCNIARGGTHKKRCATACTSASAKFNRRGGAKPVSSKHSGMSGTTPAR